MCNGVDEGGVFFFFFVWGGGGGGGGASYPVRVLQRLQDELSCSTCVPL